MGGDQLGGALGVDEPGSVSAGHLVEPGAVNLVDGRPCALDGQVRVVGSDDKDRGRGDRGELHAGEDTLGAWAGSCHPSPGLVNAWHTSMRSPTPRRPASPATGR